MGLSNRRRYKFSPALHGEVQRLRAHDRLYYQEHQDGSKFIAGTLVMLVATAFVGSFAVISSQATTAAIMSRPNPIGTFFQGLPHITI